MKTLSEALDRMDNKGGAADSLRKHLSHARITDWDDITRTRLYDLKDELLNTVAASTAKTILARFSALLHRVEDEIALPKDWESILHVKAEKPVKTYLTGAELKSLEGVATKNGHERFVLLSFLIGAYTGMRISDTREITSENIVDGFLSYVSLKTSVHSVVPISPKTVAWIEEMKEAGISLPLASYNRIIRRLAQRAGIDEVVKIFKAGKHLTKEKWECISSHTARISFCSNLAACGCPMNDISRMAGHTSINTTTRYVCDYKIELPKRAMGYLNA